MTFVLTHVIFLFISADMKKHIERIDQWLEDTGTSEAKLGLMACGNPRAVARIRAGTASIKTLETVLEHVILHPPLYGTLYLLSAPGDLHKIGIGSTETRRRTFAQGFVNGLQSVRTVLTVNLVDARARAAEAWVHLLMKRRGVPSPMPEWYIASETLCRSVIEDAKNKSKAGPPTIKDRGGRSAKVAGRGPGRPKNVFSDETIASMRLFWFSPAYPTDQMAIVAMSQAGIRTSVSRITKLLGKSGRKLGGFKK